MQISSWVRRNVAHLFHLNANLNLFKTPHEPVHKATPYRRKRNKGQIKGNGQDNAWHELRDSCSSSIAPTLCPIFPTQHDLTIMKVFTSSALVRDLGPCVSFFPDSGPRAKLIIIQRQQKVIQNTQNSGTFGDLYLRVSRHLWEMFLPKLFCWRRW